MELKLFGRALYAALPDDGTFPNSLLPLVVSPAALGQRPDLKSIEARARAFERLFSQNSWPPAWRNGIYPYHHYHSTAHEALGIAGGSILVLLGGDDGLTVRAGPGDCIVIPAGVAHRRMEASDDLLIVGAYPRGQAPDMLYGRPGERPGADANIAGVPLPVRDPAHGVDGPLLALWRLAGGSRDG
jgi:uncharacterized protein YjlB